MTFLVSTVKNAIFLVRTSINYRAAFVAYLIAMPIIFYQAIGNRIWNNFDPNGINLPGIEIDYSYRNWENEKMWIRDMIEREGLVETIILHVCFYGALIALMSIVGGLLLFVPVRLLLCLIR